MLAESGGGGVGRGQMRPAEGTGRCTSCADPAVVGPEMKTSGLTVVRQPPSGDAIRPKGSDRRAAAVVGVAPHRCNRPTTQRAARRICAGCQPHRCGVPTKPVRPPREPARALAFAARRRPRG